MIRFTYKLFEGRTPKAKLTETFGRVGIRLGDFSKVDPLDNKEIIYGEIDIQPEQVSTLQTALSSWQISVFASDAEALAYLDTVDPVPDFVLQYKIVQKSAVIVGDRAEKPTQEIIQ